MLNKSVAQLKEIASAGGGFIIDASKFSTAALKEISASGKGHIIFDFMD